MSLFFNFFEIFFYFHGKLVNQLNYIINQFIKFSHKQTIKKIN